MLNRSASLAMSTCVLKALLGKLDIKRHSPIIFCKNKCNFALCLVAAELQLILAPPFNSFKRYVLFDCIDSENKYNKNKQVEICNMYYSDNVGIKLVLV